MYKNIVFCQTIVLKTIGGGKMELSNEEAKKLARKILKQAKKHKIPVQKKKKVPLK